MKAPVPRQAHDEGPGRPSSLLALLSPPAASAQPPEPRRLLERQTEAMDLSRVLAPAESFRPYPTIDDRDAWYEGPGGTAARIRRRSREAARDAVGGASGHPLPGLRARRQPQPLRDAPLLAAREARRLLVLGELLEGRAASPTRSPTALWLICEESFWGVPAARRRAEARGGPARRHGADRRPLRRRDGRAARVDRLPDRRPARRRPPARARAPPPRGGPAHPDPGARARRLLVDGLHAAARSTTGTRGSTRTGWRRAAPRARSGSGARARCAKIARSLDRFVDAYPDDGGCDEGPAYWGRAGASLFEALELLHAATGGRVDVYREPLVREIGRYIARAYIAGDYYVNIGDALGQGRRPSRSSSSATAGRPATRRSPRFGACLAARRGPYGPGDVAGLRQPRAAPCRRSSREATSKPPRPSSRSRGDVWLPDLQMMAAREKPGTTDGLYVAAWGGHNGAEPQPQRRRQLDRLRRRPARARRRRAWRSTRRRPSARGATRSGRCSRRGTTCPSINGVDQRDGASFRARDVAFAPGRVPCASRWTSRPRTRPRRRSSRYRRDGDARPPAGRDRPRRGLRARRLPRAGAAPLPDAAAEPDVATPGRVRARGRAATPPRRPPGPTCSSTTRSASPRASRRRRSPTLRLPPVWGDRLYRITLAARACSTSGRHRFVVRPE